MKNLTNKEQFNHIFQHSAFDIVEGAHGENYDKVEFTFKDKAHCAHGDYELIDDVLNFNVCYQIESEMFDIEHVCENGEESITFQNIEPYTGTATFKNGKVHKISIAEHPSKGDKSWTFSAKNGQRFLTLD